MDSVFREIKIVKIKIAFHEGEVVWKCCEARRMPELGENSSSSLSQSNSFNIHRPI
jgi:hypothetical protein